MKILAIDHLLPGKTFDDVKPHLRNEAEKAWKLYEKGVFRELYMRGGKPGAVVVLECRDVEEARSIMADLPLVREKIIEFDFMALEPFTPFASLFAR